MKKIAPEKLIVLGETGRYFTRSRRPKAIANAVTDNQYKINRKLMRHGVIIIDPTNTYIGPDVTIGPTTIIEPGTHIYGQSVIGEGNRIGPDAYLENVHMGKNNRVMYSCLIDVKVGSKTILGPYFSASNGTKIGKGYVSGSFVSLDNEEVAGESAVAPEPIPEKPEVKEEPVPEPKVESEPVLEEAPDVEEPIVESIAEEEPKPEEPEEKPAE